jgi:hypothetical protein
LTIGMLTMMFLNMSAFLALEWKNITLVPVIIGLPGIVYTWLFFPMNPDFTPNRGAIMGISMFIQTIIPFLLYTRLWYRIRKAGGRGYSRPLFLALGIIFLILGSAGGTTTELVPAIMLAIAFTLWGLGITGEADKLLKTA